MSASAAASRQVQRLHLRAPDATLARRGVRLLEDALRTASLPHAGARMLVFRRLALGRFGSGVSPQTLSLALERRVAELRGRAVHATAPGAAQTAAIWFRDALEAHILLAQRIADGAPAHEWFWSLVVPGIEKPTAVPQRLRMVVQSLARLPEAPAALPVLAGALAQRGHADLVRTATGLAKPATLLRVDASNARSGAAAMTRDASPPTGHGREPGPLAHEARDRAPSPAAPIAVAGDGVPIAHDGKNRISPAVLALQRHPIARKSDAAVSFRSALPDRMPARPTATDPAIEAGATPPRPPISKRQVHAVAGMAARAPLQPADATIAEAAAERRRAQALPPSARARSRTPTPPGEPPAAARPSASSKAATPHAAVAGNVDPAEASSSLRLEPWHCAAPTQAGGLLFLLPVLARLGYAQWLDEAPDWAPLGIHRSVLARVCGRLALPADDPAWWLCPTSASPLPNRYCAPSRWCEGIADCSSAWRRCAAGHGMRLCDASGRLLLAAWRGRRRPAALAPLLRGRGVVHSDAGRQEPDLSAAVAEAWLIACRRWLRRYARVGLAGLVMRPARLSLTPTHADMFFALSDVSLAVRRTGLDLDPGWVPWFGRVVSFHYGRLPWT